MNARVSFVSFEPLQLTQVTDVKSTRCMILHLPLSVAQPPAGILWRSMADPGHLKWEAAGFVVLELAALSVVAVAFLRVGVLL